MNALVERVCEHPAKEAVYGGLLSRCTDCGLVATTEKPSFEYKEDYFTEEGKGGYDFDTPFAKAHDAARFVPELKRLESHGLKGSVLDVGCATGSFLAHAQARGWSVAGVEVAEYARTLAEKRLGGVGLAASLQALPPTRRYDVVTLHHVLEHIPEPLPFLRDEVRPRVGRRLLIEVPNFASLAANVHGPKWRDLRPDQHLFHYSAETLVALLRRAQFMPLEVYTLWEPLWSLRTARDLLVQVGSLVIPPKRRAEDSTASGPAAVTDVRGYIAPSGGKRVVVEASRWAFRPLVRALERAGMGERLVALAEPLAETRQPA